MRYFLWIGWAFSVCALEKLEFKRPDGSLLVAYLETPTEKSYPLLFLVQGAQAETVRNLQKNLSVQNPWGLIALEKRDLGDPEKYPQHHCLKERFEDHALVLTELKKGRLPAWNGKWAALGQGDGGKIAAALAAENPDISALILVAAGGAWEPEREVVESFRKELVEQSFTPYYIHSFLDLVKRQLKSAQDTPVWDQETFGFTHLYWASWLSSNLPGYLAKCHCPIYYAYGEGDDRVPLASAQALLEQMKDRPQFTALSQPKGREIIKDPKTYDAALKWLQGKL